MTNLLTLNLLDYFHLLALLLDRYKSFQLFGTSSLNRKASSIETSPCEAIEAAVRSIKEPDILKIEAMIDKIINQRIEDGQLSECPLTLDELRKIKGTVDGTTGMLPVLRGIYHIRVEYPDDPKS